jgi:hypothetical protein
MRGAFRSVAICIGIPLFCMSGTSQAVEVDARCREQVHRSLTEALARLSASQLPRLSTDSYRQWDGLPLIRKFRLEDMKRNSALSQGKVFSIENLEKSRSSALEALTRAFRSDPVFSGLSAGQHRRSAERVLAFRPIDHVEQISDIAAIEVERYRIALRNAGFSPERLQVSYEEMFRELEVPYLSHAAPSDWILDILKAEKISPGKLTGRRSMGGDNRFVYLDVPEKRLAQEIDDPTRSQIFYEDAVRESAAIFLFPPEVLDRFSLSHMNFFWQHGAFSPSHSIASSNLIASFLNLYKNTDVYDQGLRFFSEFMLRREIDLSQIGFRLLMNPAIKKKFLAAARQKGISQKFLDRIEWRATTKP